MQSVYKIQGPAIISFSGGRTSGYMLYHILEAYDGKLPDDVVVAFANTGKERSETLDFVNDCSGYWGVPINWLEFRVTNKRKQDFVIVDYESASRHGEPFDQLIHKKNYVPHTMGRYCTIELKIGLIRKFGREVMEFKHWNTAIGLRADEGNRVKKLNEANAKNKDPWTSYAPMFDAGVTEDDVFAFWREQPFDLQLESHEGNCDLCFLKGANKISRILRENPELAQWWISKESITNTRFRLDRPKYKDLLEGVLSQQEFNFGIFDDETSCDSNGCTD